MLKGVWIRMELETDDGGKMAKLGVGDDAEKIITRKIETPGTCFSII